MNRKYRITSKFRFTVFVCLTLCFAAFAITSLLSPDTASSMSELPYAEVQIQSGDTLWNVARKFGPPDCDTRQVVYEICRINGINASDIQPGQSLLIPVTI